MSQGILNVMICNKWLPKIRYTKLKTQLSKEIVMNI